MRSRHHVLHVLIPTLVGLAAPAAGGAPRWPENMVLRAQICVERPGDAGRLNLRAADVVVDGGPILRMIGEQAACAFVQAGRYRVWAQSTDPFDPASTKIDAWKSAVLVVSAAENQRVELEVCGAGTNGAYTNWRIERVAGRCPQQ